MPLPKRRAVLKPGKEKSEGGDARFSNFSTDPKFRLPSKKLAKTKLDPRFARLKDDPDFYNKATVDKYGRKIAKDAGKKNIERLFDMDHDDDDDDDDDELDPQARVRDKDVLKELARVEELGFDPIRDGGLESSSDESSSDEDEDVVVEEQAALAAEGDDVPTGDVTSRLAVVNLDWDNIRATDILVVANSFVPPNGSILNVVIYPSEFGLERMQREDIEGPPREIFASTANKNKDNLTSLAESPDPFDSDDDGDGDGDDDDELDKDDTGEDFDSKALRQYQLDRLRYYYAVITCSSPNVAKAIYDNLDGQEYLSSANLFDLRFVPDEVTFDEAPRDECERIPEGYKPNEFTTDALTHSNVKLTWDADDTTRKEVQKRAFSRKEIDENELQAYLGSDQSSSEDEEEAARADKAASLRAALGLEPSGKSAKSKPKSRSSEKRDRDFQKPDGDMQITFTSGISEDATKGSVFENDPHETTLEKYVRKQKERKEKRKERAKALKEGRDPDADESDDEPGPAPKADDEDPWNDPFFGADPEDAKTSKAESNKTKRAKKREEREKKDKESAAERANLELLMVDDEDSHVRHFDMNEIMKAEKAKKKGKKRSKDKEAMPDRFQLDTSDPRFSKLFESHEYAIDPTNPRFKGTSGMKALLEEGRKKRKHDRDDDQAGRDKKAKKAEPGETDDVMKLAARVKAKSKKA